MATIPNVNEQWPTYLWEDVHNAKQGSNTYVSAPMEELELGHELPLDQESLYGVMRLVKSESSANETLAELLHFLGDYEANSKIKRLPSVRGTRKKQRDTHNLSSILSTPIKFTLTLGGLLKMRPHLWQDLSKTLNQLGILGLSSSQVKELKNTNE